MGLNFYETIGGRRFVDGTIPRLVDAIEESNKGKKQYACLSRGDEYQVISGQLKKGNRFVSAVKNLTDDSYTLIFEEK